MTKLNGIDAEDPETIAAWREYVETLEAAL
jgi:hypothetical protein